MSMFDAPQKPSRGAPDAQTSSRIERKGRVTSLQVQKKKEANKRVLQSAASRVHLDVVRSSPTITEPKTSNRNSESKKEQRKSTEAPTVTVKVQEASVEPTPKQTTPTNQSALTPNQEKYRMKRQSSSANVPEVVIKSYWDKFSIQEGHGKMNIIQASQLKSLCYEMGIYLEPEDLNIVLANIDTNHNGTIEFAEFLVWWRSSKKIAKLASLENEKVQQSIAYFKYFDVDGNGYITSEEFYDLYLDLVKSGLIDSSLSKEAALNEIDPDHDQVITFDNFMEWMGCIVDDVFIGDNRTYS